MNRRRYAPFSTRFGGRRVGDEGVSSQAFTKNIVGEGEVPQLSFTHRSEKPFDSSSL